MRFTIPWSSSWRWESVSLLLLSGSVTTLHVPSGGSGSHWYLGLDRVHQIKRPVHRFDITRVTIPPSRRNDARAQGDISMAQAGVAARPLIDSDQIAGTPVYSADAGRIGTIR